MNSISVKILGTTYQAFQYPVEDSNIALVQAGSKILYSLLENFRKCDAAEDLLSRVASAVKLTMWYMDDPNEVARTVFTDRGPLIILFPEDDLVGTLAFELTNAERGFDNARAKKGEQGMDEYAKKIGMDEHSAQKKRYDLWQKCFREWGAKKPISLTKPSSKEVYEFEREWDCTFDAYRDSWRSKYKNVFCKKNPKDTECTRPRDLCLNMNKFHSVKKQDPESLQWMGHRLCNLFPKASEGAKPELRQNFRLIIESYCPQFLSVKPQATHSDL